jgi:hypothetical protein
MGRVSRILKAATDRSSEARPAGLERELAVSDPDLPRVIACWSVMPPHFRQTILTLVEVVEAKLRSETTHDAPPPPEAPAED